MSAEALRWAKEFDAGSPTKKAILLILADYADQEWSCFPGQETLARMACTSVRTVRRVLTEWEEEGLISRRHRKAKEGRGRTSDRIYLHPGDQPDTVSPWSGATNRPSATDQPDTGGRPTGQSLSGDIPVEPPVEPQALTLVHPPSPERSIDVEFEAWWQEYPKGRRQEKAQAKVEYRKARRDADPQELLAAVVAFRRLMDAQRTEPQYIPYAHRWLKKRRWEDETPAARNPFQGPEMRFG